MGEPAWAFFDGAFKPLTEATINVQSRVVQYGLGCFEGIRAYWNEEDAKLRIFRVRDHFERLAHSCRILSLPCGTSVERMIEITCELCRRNAYRTGVYLRPIVFNNSRELSPIMSEEDNIFAVYGFPLRDYLDTSGGITACVSSWRRVSDNMIPARAKPCAAYLNSALARFEAKANGFDEAIFLTGDGYVSEGSAEHVFLVRDGELLTPTCQDDNLEGITRRSLVALAREELGRKVTERRIARTELYVADEIFFCGTGAEVTPVTAVDRRTVGDGRPGPATLELQELFFKVVRGAVAKYADWCCAVET
jgi:branched-chain amino acid aminotransferase